MDTGSGPHNHVNSAATEWFVAFYKPRRVKPAPELTTGFPADDRSDNPDYECAPYTFAFRAGHADFVLISVHLNPGGGGTDRAVEGVIRYVEQETTIAARNAA